MNREWAGLNKNIQADIRKQDTFDCGISLLSELRQKLMDALFELRSELSDGLLCECPFMNVDGYHSKTIAYSIWHIFRIEDIVANSVIHDGEQIFVSGHYSERIGSPITTTGNELKKQQIIDFSRKLNIDELFGYALRVKESTDDYLRNISFADLRAKPSGDREKVIGTSVSSDESAAWLIDYWFDKDIKGLIQMPFSRHWIMHTEAAVRIKNKLLGIK